jgi:hypothetical protein
VPILRADILRSPIHLAERVRFELTNPVRGLRFSRPVQSTALPPLRLCGISALAAFYQASEVVSEAFATCSLAWHACIKAITVRYCLLSRRRYDARMSALERASYPPALALRGAVLAIAVAGSLGGCERVEPAAVQGGVATLTWSAVTRDAQGGELKNLAGYKVYYGTAPRALYSVVVVPDPHLTTYVVHDLAPGSWYFAVAAYTTGNVDGVRSNVVAKNVQ